MRGLACFLSVCCYSTMSAVIPRLWTTNRIIVLDIHLPPHLPCHLLCHCDVYAADPSPFAITAPLLTVAHDPPARQSRLGISPLRRLRVCISCASQGVRAGRPRAYALTACLPNQASRRREINAPASLGADESKIQKNPQPMRAGRAKPTGRLATGGLDNAAFLLLLLTTTTTNNNLPLAAAPQAHAPLPTHHPLPSPVDAVD